MRTSVLLGAVATAAVFAVTAIIGLRGSAPPPHDASQTAANTPAKPAATSAGPPARLSSRPPAPAATPPSFDVVTVDPNGQAVIAGRAVPGDRVRVLDGGKPLGEATADARGEWVLVPTAPLAPGDRALSAEATARDGGPARHSGDAVALSVKPPAGPGAGTAATAVLLPGDARKDATVLQAPAAVPGAPRLALDTAEYGAGDRLSLSGQADPGAKVTVYAGDKLIGTATADAAGKWSLAARQKVAGGLELRLDQLAADGHVTSRIAAPVETPATEAPSDSRSYFVQRGNSLWVIARNVYGQGLRYTAIYSANRGQIRDPDLIYPGQLFKIPKS